MERLPDGRCAVRLIMPEWLYDAIEFAAIISGQPVGHIYLRAMKQYALDTIIEVGAGDGE